MRSSGDISKLPQWAQRRMAVLEMRVREAQERVRERGPDESSVQAYPYSDVPLELGDPTIQFRRAQRIWAAGAHSPAAYR